MNLIHPHEVQGHHEVAHRIHDRLETIFEFAVGASLTDNYPFIGLKKALASKLAVVNQPAIHPDEAHDMLEQIKNSRDAEVAKNENQRLVTSKDLNKAAKQYQEIMLRR